MIFLKDVPLVKARQRQKGVPVFLANGGYQLLGQFYRTRSGAEIPGIGLFAAYTVAGTRRMTGNIAVRVPFLPSHIPVGGFENHSGRTFLQADGVKGCVGAPTVPLGRVIYGYGNNGDDGTEGARCANAFGTYLHGLLLAKNPHLADYLLTLALERRYGEPFALAPIDDTLELTANREVFRRFRGRPFPLLRRPRGG